MSSDQGLAGEKCLTRRSGVRESYSPLHETTLNRQGRPASSEPWLVREVQFLARRCILWTEYKTAISPPSQGTVAPPPDPPPPLLLLDDEEEELLDEDDELDELELLLDEELELLLLEEDEEELELLLEDELEELPVIEPVKVTTEYEGIA